MFDKDNSGTISLKELMDGLSLLTNGSELDKLNFLFQVYDVDGENLCNIINTYNSLIHCNVEIFKKVRTIPYTVTSVL